MFALNCLWSEGLINSLNQEASDIFQDLLKRFHRNDDNKYYFWLHQVHATCWIKVYLYTWVQYIMYLDYYSK